MRVTYPGTSIITRLPGWVYVYAGRPARNLSSAMMERTRGGKDAKEWNFSGASAQGIPIRLHGALMLLIAIGFLVWGVLVWGRFHSKLTIASRTPTPRCQWGLAVT